MDYVKIISDKGGKILKDSDDPFDELELKCENDHLFFAFFNDIVAGKWCPLCDKKEKKEEEQKDEEEDDLKMIKIALDQLKIKYERNMIIGKNKFSFVIESAKLPFIIEENKYFNTEKFKTAEKNKYAMIIIKNLNSVKDLSQEIWKSIMELKDKTRVEDDNKIIVYIGDSNKEIFKHTCTEIERLNEHSFIKSAPKPWPEMVKIAVGYTRVSTEYQVKDGHSLEAQEGEIAAEAKRKGIFISRFYIDEGVRADEWDKRLGFDRLVKEIKENETLMATRLDRVGRNAKDILDIHQNLQERGCFLSLMDLQFDTNTSMGKMMLTVFSAQAELEKATISERVKATMQFMKKNNLLRIKPPVGLRMNPDRSEGAPMHIVDEKERMIIEEIKNYRRKYPDLKITAFADKLNKLKVKPPRKSKRWHHASLKIIMMRENIPTL